MLSSETKRALTSSLVLSIPVFLDVVYGPFLTTFNKYRVQKIQNSCVRYVKLIPRRDHVSQHISNIYHLDMSQRRFVHVLLITLHMSCLLHKQVVITGIPSYLTEAMVRRSEVIPVNVRNQNAICIPRHETQFF